MSDRINSTSFHTAVGKSRQIMLLISEPNKDKIDSCICLGEQ